METLETLVLKECNNMAVAKNLWVKINLYEKMSSNYHME